MVRFETKFNSESSDSLSKFQMKKITWVYVVFSLFFIVLGIIGAVGGTDSEDFAFGLGFIVFGVLFFPICFVITKLFQKNTDKSMPLLHENTEQIFEFDGEKIKIFTRLPGVYESRTEASYRYLFKVAENRDNYFLYISKAASHVIAKKYLTLGTLDEFYGYLRANFDTVRAGRGMVQYYNVNKK